MEIEHDEAGSALERLQELTDAYTPPACTCNPCRILMDNLAQFECDLLQPSHKGSTILLPPELATREIKPIE